MGGHDLDNARESYLYFLIRQDGRFLIKQRTGGALQTLADWAPSAAIHADTAGAATNELEVQVGNDDLRFLVNGQQVAAMPRDARYVTDGVAGYRINHNLDVHVGRLEVEPVGVRAAASR